MELIVLLLEPKCDRYSQWLHFQIHISQQSGLLALAEVSALVLHFTILYYDLTIKQASTHVLANRVTNTYICLELHYTLLLNHLLNVLVLKNVKWEG